MLPVLQMVLQPGVPLLTIVMRTGHFNLPSTLARTTANQLLDTCWLLSMRACQPGVAVGDGVCVGVADGVWLGVADGVWVGVADGVWEGVADGVWVGVADGVWVDVADGV